MNLIIIFTGPSGSGKTTWCNYLVEKFDFCKPKTFTTRDKRIEEDENSYHFISKSEFLSKINAGEMLEYVENMGNYYGCGLSSIPENARVTLALDARGALAVKNKLQNVVIILLKIDAKTMQQRMILRSNACNNEQQKRLNEAKQYLNFDYNYFIDASGSIQQVSMQIDNIIKKII